MKGIVKNELERFYQSMFIYFNSKCLLCIKKLAPKMKNLSFSRPNIVNRFDFLALYSIRLGGSFISHFFYRRALEHKGYVQVLFYWSPLMKGFQSSRISEIVCYKNEILLNQSIFHTVYIIFQTTEIIFHTMHIIFTRTMLEWKICKFHAQNFDICMHNSQVFSKLAT